jgi:hypothetical protein
LGVTNANILDRRFRAIGLARLKKINVPSFRAGSTVFRMVRLPNPSKLLPELSIHSSTQTQKPGRILRKAQSISSPSSFNEHGLQPPNQRRKEAGHAGAPLPAQELQNAQSLSWLSIASQRKERKPTRRSVAFSRAAALGNGGAFHGRIE